MAQRKAMHGTDEGAVPAGDTKLCQTGLKFDRALIIVSDAGDAARIDHIFDQCADHRRRQGLGLATAGTGQDNTMTAFENSSQLFRVGLELCHCMGKRAIVRHG